MKLVIVYKSLTGRPTNIGEFKVSPSLSDHSVFQSRTYDLLDDAQNKQFDEDLEKVLKSKTYNRRNRVRVMIAKPEPITVKEPVTATLEVTEEVKVAPAKKAPAKKAAKKKVAK